MLHASRTSLGFTLIELLVVIAIVSLLSSIVLSSINSARSKARDAQRTMSIKQVQTALELYYNDNFQYPSAGDVTLEAALTAPLTTKYISVIPTDPKPTGVYPGGYRYFTESSNPAPFYAISIVYENKLSCYVCAGKYQNLESCTRPAGYWGIDICK